MSAIERIKAELDDVAVSKTQELLYQWVTELNHLESIDVAAIEARKSELRALIEGGETLLREGAVFEAQIRKAEIAPDPNERG